MTVKKQYEGKRFSVLGDSISTLDGYSVPSDAAFYSGVEKLKADVYTPTDTWWGIVINRLGAELLVNNSISGSMVIKHRACMIESYGCSDERTSSLGRDGITPDVIMIFMGINDWDCGARVVPADESHESDISVFSTAYGTMLDKLSSRYPDCELWCLTLPVSTWSEREDFEYPYLYGDRHLTEYCDAIRTVASGRGCRVIDVFNSDIPYDTIDGFHPNFDGMRTISDAVIKSLNLEE